MRFYINKHPQRNGDHEIHTSVCIFLPHEYRRHDLGEHYSCSDALQAAKEHFDQVNGCYFCSRLCHEK